MRSGGDRERCGECGREFANAGCLTLHERAKHPDFAEREAAIARGRADRDEWDARKLNCECGKKFETEKGLNVHHGYCDGQSYTRELDHAAKHRLDHLKCPWPHCDHVSETVSERNQHALTDCPKRKVVKEPAEAACAFVY